MKIFYKLINNKHYFLTGICLKYIFDARIVTFIKQVIYNFKDN